MLNKLVDQLGATLYVQIWEKRIRVTNIDSGKIFDESPLVAVEARNGRRIVAAVGNRAASVSGQDVEVINPFSHPRSLLRDFSAGEKLLQHIFRKLTDQTLFTPSPIVVLQPMEKTQGGLTEVEVRAFRELALGAGAREVEVYQGEELTRHTFDYAKVKAKGQPQKNGAKNGGGQAVQWFLILLWIVLITLMAVFGGS
ncbi:rod shape-determining protein [Microbulbifer marinus]|uniref:Rod shape-determining protein MreB n=1 Tax=Microbulbifer marinus TaxID=658218 RepID=A0A1H3W960_9GAMM|nr:rod shape-determining protein [Microbulbifer marinus]SDZ83626.1 rod shape-determining protein MreB [Microbulbifer marinus]